MSKQSAIKRLRHVTEDLLIAQDHLDAAMHAFDFDAETEQWGILSDAVEAIEKARSGLRRARPHRGYRRPVAGRPGPPGRARLRREPSETLWRCLLVFVAG